MLKEFREFALKGNMLDLAIGLILGTAFGNIVTSLVNDVVMPPIGLLLGRVDFADLFLAFSDKPFISLKAARDAGVAVVAYGVFINNLINFLIVAFVMFLIVRQANQLRKSAGKLASKGASPANAGARGD